MRHRYAPTPTERFVQELIAIGGKPAALWLPGYSVVKTAYDPTGIRIFTSANTPAPTAQGNGALLTFNGSSDYWTTPDTDDLSFGNGTTDSPFSIVALGNITTVAAPLTLFAKDNEAGQGEYLFSVNNGGTLQLILFNNGTSAVIAYTYTNAAVTRDAPHLYTVSYDGRGSTTAASGITFYEDAASVVSTAVNSASYVAMQNTSLVAAVGASSGPSLYFKGSLGFTAVYGTALTVAQQVQIKAAVNAYYGLAL